MRKGLFFSRHNGNISSAVDIDKLVEAYRDLTVVKVFDDFFDTDQQAAIVSHATTHKLDGVVLAGDSAARYDSGKQGDGLIGALTAAGINKNKIAFANLYEQLARTLPPDGALATQKARLLIDTALAKVTHCRNLETMTFSPRKAVLIAGTNAGSVIAAEMLRRRGIEVFLVDKTISWRTSEEDKQAMGPIIAQFETDANVDIHFRSTITDIFGWCGEYRAALQTPSGRKEIVAGCLLMGAVEDKAWIAELSPKMRLDTNDDGSIAALEGDAGSGKTGDPGIWYLPFEEAGFSLKEKTGLVRQIAQPISELLKTPKIEHDVLVSEVDENLCGGCGTCVKTCAFGASGIDPLKKISVIDSKRCIGCGNCVTSCPTGARNLVAFPTAYVSSAIDILGSGLEGMGNSAGPGILAFLCKNSGYPAADLASDPSCPGTGTGLPLNVMPLRIECGGNVDTLYILRAFEMGFAGVALVVCKDGHCHNVVGNTDMERRMGLLRAVLRSRRIDDNRIRIIHTSARDGDRFAREMKAFSDELKQMAP